MPDILADGCQKDMPAMFALNNLLYATFTVNSKGIMTLAAGTGKFSQRAAEIAH